MAYTFNGSTQYLNATTVGDDVGGYPCTLFARANTSDDTASGIFLMYGQQGAPYNGMAMWLFGATTSPVADPFFWSRFGESDNASTNSFTANTWYSIGGRSASNAVSDIYADDIVTAKATSTAWPGTGPGQIIVGGRLTPTLSNPFTGAVCSIAVWDAELSDDEMHSLTVGFSPRRVRPQSLRNYAPLVRELHLWVTTGNSVTLSATASPTVSAHPRAYGL